ncbi:hypothetical protein CR513_48198, partial [Mucuna pruriens]
MSRHVGTLLSDLTPQYLAIGGGTLQTTMAIVTAIRIIRKRNFGSLHPFDPKIEKNLNSIRKSKNMHVGYGSNSFSSIPETDHFEIKPNFADNPLFESEPIENNNRTLKELAMPNVLYQPWCIQYLRGPTQTFEGVPRGLLFDETVGDTKGLHKDKGVFVLLRWSSERLAIFADGYVQDMRRYKANFPREVLLSIQDSGHPKGDLRNPSTFEGNFA